MSKEERKIREYLAFSDDGRQFRILEFGTFIDGTIPGLRRLQTDDGHSVNRKSDGVFEIVGLELIVRTVPPTR